MSTEDNKKVVLGVLEAFSRFDIDSVLKAYTDDMRWWLAGNGNFSGWWKRPDIDNFYRNFRMAFPEGLEMIADHMVAEGDYVAVEGHTKSPIAGKSYRNYSNKYHWLFKLRDGKIELWKEYLDTKLYEEAFSTVAPDTKPDCEK